MNIRVGGGASPSASASITVNVPSGTAILDSSGLGIRDSAGMFIEGR